MTILRPPSTSQVKTIVGAFICVLLISPVGFTADPAAKETKQPNDVAAAKVAFSEGSRLFNEKQYSAAAEAFRKAMALSPTWKLHYNIGQSEAASKRFGLALSAFEMYLSGGGDNISTEREEEVLAEISKLKLKVGNLSIDAPKGAVVIVDNIERATAPVLAKIRISAGVQHMVQIVRNDSVLREETIQVGSQENIELTVVAPLADAMPPTTQNEPSEPDTVTTESALTAEPPAPEQTSPLRTVGVVTMAVGAAALVAGTITGIATLKQADALKENCDNSTQCSPNDKDSYNSATKLANTSTALFIAGGTMAVAGIVLTILGSRQTNETLTVAPALGPTYSGFMFKGRF